MSVLYALASLLFAGVNDLLFKKQATGGDGRGRHMAIVGVVWTAVFAADALLLRRAAPTAEALLWGLAVGTCSALANYLLIWSLRRLDASVGATVYRLNMVPAAVLAVLLLGEPFSVRKLLGLGVGILAVALFMNGTGGERRGTKGGAALALAVAAALLRALMGVAYKLAASVQREWFLSVQGLLWVAVGLFAALRLEPPRSLSKRDLSLGAVSGALICGIVFTFAKATETGEASVVIPISQMSFVVTALLSWPLLKERFGAKKILGLCLAVAAVLLLGAP